MLGHRKLDPQEYVQILKRRAWLIVVPAIVFAIAGFALTRVIPAKFISTTLVLIEQQEVADDIVKPVIATDLDSRLSSMKEQILSRSRIQPIIERYGLYSGQRVGMDERVDMARKAIVIRPIRSEIARGGGLPGFTISFTASDAHTAQLVCAEITKLFLNENQKSREASVEGTTDFLKQQLADAKRALDTQNSKMADFERQYAGKLPGEDATNVSMMTTLTTQLQASTESLARMEQQKTYMEAMLAEQAQAAQAAGGAAAPDTSTPDPLVASQQAELQTLQHVESELASHYTAAYPDLISVRRKIAELQQDLAKPHPRIAAPGAPAGAKGPVRESAGVQQLRAQLRAADLAIQQKKSEQAQIQGQIGMYQERVSSSPLVEEQYKNLTRDNASAQKFYDDLLAKMNQANMATALENRQQGEQFTVMDAANLPDGPTFPVPWMFTAAGLFLGAALGLVITGALEYRDTALRTERDVWAFTNLPTLAVIALAAQADEAVKPGRWTRLKNVFRRKKPVDQLVEASR